MTTSPSRSFTAQYAVHQSFYWMAYCGLFSFAAAYLLGRGFDTAQVGIILALANLLSCLLQPLAASFADRSDRLSLPQIIGAFTLLSALALLALHFAALPPFLFAALYLAAGLLLDATQPLINALSVYYSSRGDRLDFGIGRGLGSMAFAVSSIGIGAAMKRFGGESMVLISLFLLGCCLAVTLLYPRRDAPKPERSSASQAAQGQVCTLAEFFRRYKLYCVSLLAVLFLAAFHSMTENYFITLMESLGGDSRHVGVALAVATIVEVPVFVFFTPIRRKVSTAKLLRISALTFLVKAVVLLMARNIFAVYAAELLQATSYGLLIPAGVLYAQQSTAPQDMVKGQALFTAAYALGCSCGNFLGGQLITFGGIRLLLQAGCGLAAVGTAILFASIRGHKKFGVSDAG